MELLRTIAQREVVIALAIVGAVIATAGHYIVNRSRYPDSPRARLVLRIGYGITWASIGLFIVAGFLPK